MESTKLKVVVKYFLRMYPVFIGAAAGYLYYSLIGCVTGKCAITSNPFTSTIFGALFGAAFIGKKSKQKKIG